jgi:hypothetical protein
MLLLTIQGSGEASGNGLYSTSVLMLCLLCSGPPDYVSTSLQCPGPELRKGAVFVTAWSFIPVVSVTQEVEEGE